MALQCRSRSRDSDSITLDFGLRTRFDGLRLRTSDSIRRAQASGFGLRSWFWAYGFGLHCFGLRASDSIRRAQASGFGLDSTGSGFGLRTPDSIAAGFRLWASGFGFGFGLRASDSIAAGFRLWARLQQALGSRLRMGLHWTSDLIATNFCPVCCKLPAFFFF